MIMLNYDYIIKLRPFVRARGALYIRSYYDSYMIYMISSSRSFQSLND